MSIVVKGLTKMYGEQKAVDNLSFSIEKGEVVGFLGPNGAGKSTTMKITTGYIPPTLGAVHICGHNVVSDSLAIRKKIGYLPEHNPLYLDMYVHEYLSFIAGIHKLKNRQIRTKEILGMCGLTREQNKKIGSLSKGYRQRIGLAQSLLHDPEVLILDEPTTGLDPNQILEIRKLIKDVSRDKTVIFSTHIMQEVEAMCHRVLIINHGKLVSDNTVDQLKKSQNSVKKLVVSFKEGIDTNLLGNIDGINEIVEKADHHYVIQYESDSVKSEILALAAKQDWSLESLKEEVSSLESIFHQLTNKEATL